MSEPVFSNHHRFQKCDGGSNHPDNIIRMKHKQHKGLHALFGDTTLPNDKVEFIINLHRPAFCVEYVQDIMKVIDFWRAEGKDAYNPNVLKEDNIFSRGG